MTGIRKKAFGVTSRGEEATLYTLANESGLEVDITDFGATIVAVRVPSGNGKHKDVVLGFDDVTGYENTKYYLGATIGRHTGQINRGTFELNGAVYHTFINDHGNTMHGGEKGFDKRLFKSQNEEDKLVFTLFSPDGEEGFPGNLNVKVTYSLDSEGRLKMHYTGVSDADTILSMTNHSYFNLDGHDSGDVTGHILWIDSDAYTLNDENGSPTGEIEPVKGTPMDFTAPWRIGERIGQGDRQLLYCSGYDHNWILKNRGKELVLAAELANPARNRRVRVFSNKPGLQIYIGNYVDGSEAGKNGVRYQYRGGVCMETQYFPNSMSHPHFPSPVLRNGSIYDYTTVYQFLFDPGRL